MERQIASNPPALSYETISSEYKITQKDSIYIVTYKGNPVVTTSDFNSIKQYIKVFP